MRHKADTCAARHMREHIDDVAMQARPGSARRSFSHPIPTKLDRHVALWLERVGLVCGASDGDGSVH